MKMFSFAAVAFVAMAAVSVAEAKPYKAADKPGASGYFNVPEDGPVWTVGYTGEPGQDAKEIAQYAMKRAADLAAAIAEHPLRRHHDDDARLLVLFTQDAAGLAALKPLEATDWSPEAFAVSAHAAWLWCADGVNDSPVTKAAGKLLKATGTTRNWATVCKLDALAREA